MAEDREERAERLPAEPLLPDVPEGEETTAGGTATVVLGAAAGTIAGSLLGPVGAVVGAVAGGALASTMSDNGLDDVGDVDVERPKSRGRSLVQGITGAMNGTMHEMGLEHGGLNRMITDATDVKHLEQNVKDAMQDVSKNETASIAVGGTAGAVVGSILGPVGTVVGAMAGGMLGDRWAEQQQHLADRSPRDVVGAIAQTCQQARAQLEEQLAMARSPEAQARLQSAIHAVNQSVAELENAARAL